MKSISKKGGNFSKRLKASVYALGCRLNQYEGLAIEGKLREKGYEIVPFGEKADLGVINTCTVTNETDAKSRNTIRRFTRKVKKAGILNEVRRRRYYRKPSDERNERNNRIKREKAKNKNLRDKKN